MPDTKLEYWYDWDICGPDGSILISLKKSPPPLEKDRLNDIEYLCNRINQYPDATLLNEDVWYRIVMLRQKALKERVSAESLKKVCKAIASDGRQRKDHERLKRLKNQIHSDIVFFEKIQEMTEKEGKNVEEAIDNFLTKDVVSGYEDVDKKLMQASKYEKVYYAYRRIYKILEKLMTKEEIFCFFEKAAENIYHPNPTIDVQPDGRLLTFIKKKTWFTRSSDMKIETI